jgi:hypothetical protein
MFKFLTAFLSDDDAAVTVDWVVLTAFMTGFGALIAIGIANAATDPSDSVGASLTNMTITP